jgi:hypothetical protein
MVDHPLPPCLGVLSKITPNRFLEVGSGQVAKAFPQLRIRRHLALGQGPDGFDQRLIGKKVSSCQCP